MIFCPIKCVAISTCSVSIGQSVEAEFMVGCNARHHLVSQQRLHVHVQSGNCGQQNFGAPHTVSDSHKLCSTDRNLVDSMALIEVNSMDSDLGG